MKTPSLYLDNGVLTLVIDGPVILRDGEGNPISRKEPYLTEGCLTISGNDIKSFTLITKGETE